MRLVYTHISVPNRRKEHRQEAKLGTSYAELLTTTIGQTLVCGTRLTLFSNDKPDRFFRVIKFRMDETSGIAIALKTGLPSYQVEDEDGRIHLLLHLPIKEKNTNRWCLCRERSRYVRNSAYCSDYSTSARVG